VLCSCLMPPLFILSSRVLSIVTFLEDCQDDVYYDAQHVHPVGCEHVESHGLCEHVECATANSNTHAAYRISRPGCQDIFEHAAWTRGYDLIMLMLGTS